MKTTRSMRSCRPPGATLRALLSIAAIAVLHTAHAGPGGVQTTDIYGSPRFDATYYANSPSGTHTVATPGTGAVNSASDSGTALRKFLDPLPGVGCTSATDYALVTNAEAIGAPKGAVASCIPLAVPDTTTYPGSDYYVIGIVEYAQQMHSDLPKATALRGYTQLNHPTYPATSAIVTDPLNSTRTITTYTAWPQPHYLGPIIVAVRDRPVRVKYVNLLPTGRATFSTMPTCEVITNAGGVVTVTPTGSGYISPGATSGAGVPPDGQPHSYCETITNAPVVTSRNGELMIPNDLTIGGAGIGHNLNGDEDCGTPAPNTLPALFPADAITGKHSCLFTLNRAEIHLHGGLNPWISDGTPHQWVVPAAETDPAVVQLGRHGESFVNVPDMPDPGPGAGTLFWTNQQSARLMFYHDHVSGMTRTNVYVGEAAGYVLTDPLEQLLIAGGTLPATASGVPSVTVAAGTLPSVGIPLVIEDKAFVPADIAAQDSLWSTSWWGQPGDLFFPHVYEPNQDPTSITGNGAAGRWDYGQWFFPPMSPASLKGPIPQPSLTPEGFLDTPVINGTAYPTVTLPAGVQRFRILNVPNDRMMNLSWFVADTAQPVATGAANPLTEIKMVPAVPAPALPAAPVAGTWYACPVSNLDPALYGGQPIPVLDTNGLPLNGNGLPVYGASITITTPTTLPGGAALLGGYNHFLQANVANVPGGTVGTPCWPASWPTDGRDGGVPDPTLAGPAWIQIGTEGGFLPQAQIIPPTPLGYEYNRRSVTVLNSFYHGLMMGPAERADVLVDFTPYAGKTLILYNDAPAPNPGFDARNDYYTGDVDYSASGGAPSTVAGYGPNVRTIMQVVVSGAGTPLTGAQVTSLSSTILPNVFASSQPAPLVGEPGFSPAFPTAAAAVASAVNAGRPATAQLPAGTFVPQYGKIGDVSMTFYNGAGSTTLQTAAQASGTAAPPSPDLLLGAEAIHELFDTDYGRMNSVLGYELPLTNFLTQTTVPLAYVDPTSDMLKEGETQIWKITHNGVDTHSMHFHLVNLQVVNRVGWDGSIRPPDPDEIGWKETIKMNPLEDIYVAMQAIKPMLPFNLPDSSRRLDPAQAVGGTASFTNPPAGEFPYIPTLTCADNATTPGCQPLTGLSGSPTTNVVANFGWEYVWHCHLLGHEENDMMRPLVMSVNSLVPPSPTAGAASSQAGNATTAPPTPAGMAVSWADPTPITWSAAPGATITVANNANLGNPANEIGFNVYRFDACTPGTPTAPAVCPNPMPAIPTFPAGFKLIGRAIANTAGLVDVNAFQGLSYAYAITTFNQAGESAPTTTTLVLMTAPNGPPAAPSGLMVTPNAASAPTPSTVTLAWANNATNAINFVVQRCTASSPTSSCAPADLTTLGLLTGWVDTGVVPNTTYCYAVFATNTSGASTATPLAPATACATTPALPPAAPTAVSVAVAQNPVGSTSATPMSLTVSWTNPAGNSNSGYVVQSCTGVCAAASTWNTVATVASAATTTLPQTAPQGTLVNFRVAATATLNSYVNGTIASTAQASSAYATSSAVQLPVIPAAVTGLTATPSVTGPTTVALAWIDPVPAANAAPTALTVSRATLPSTTYSLLASLAPTAVSYSDTTGLPGTSYSYQVTASNLAGYATSTVQVTTNIIIAAPTGLSATANRYNRIVVTFVNQANNETGFPIYRAQLATGVTTCPTALASYTQIATAPTARGVIGATVTYTDNGVGPGTTYCYLVTAINGAVQSSPPTGPASATTPTAPVAAPTGLTGTVVAGAAAGAAPTVTLNWNWTQAFGGLPLTGFEISRFNGTAWIVIGTVANNVRTFTDAAPVVGSTNQYQVIAYNLTAGIQTNSPIASVNVAVAAMPVAPTISAVTFARQGANDRATVTFGGGSGFTRLTVQRATNATFTAGVTTVNNATSPTTVTVGRGTNNYFRITATNASGFVYSAVVGPLVSP